MDKGITLFGSQPVGMGQGLVKYVSMEYHFGPIASGPVDLHKGRCGRHDDHGSRASQLRCISDSLCVITGGSSDEPSAFFLFRKRADFVIGAPNLIGSRILHIFRFKIYLVTGHIGKMLTVHQLCLGYYL